MASERETITDNSIYLLRGLTSLQACLGREVSGICADHISLTYGEDGKHQGDSIYYLDGRFYLNFFSDEAPLELYYDFLESSLGETIHTLEVRNNPALAEIAPGVRIRFPDLVTIKHIEVWGMDYEVSNDPISAEQREAEWAIMKEMFDGEDIEFSMTEPYEPFWPIEFDNPGKRITQRIYDESTLVFYFTEGEKMIIVPQYPSVQIRIEEADKLSPWLQDPKARRKLEITERGIIPYDRPLANGT